MKKAIYLSILSSVLLCGSLVATATFNQVDNESDISVYGTASNGVGAKSIKELGSTESIDTTYSKIYTQYGKSQDEKTDYIRFFTAVKGNLSYLKYTIEYSDGTTTVEEELNYVYKGITSNDQTYYYDGEKLTTDDSYAGQYYFACVSLEYRNENSVDVGVTASLTIEDFGDHTFNVAESTTSLGMVKYGYETIFDGKMDDKIWTDEVKAKYETIGSDEEAAKVTAYAYRGNKGIYLFFDYESVSDTSNQTEWYLGNNIEVTFTGADGLLANAFRCFFGELDNESNRVQSWASIYNGTKSHNFTHGYISDLVKNETTNRYEMTMEMYMSYEHLGYVYSQANNAATDDVNEYFAISEDNGIGFGFGAAAFTDSSNVGDSTKEWYNSTGYRNGWYIFTPKITKGGIYQVGDDWKTHINEDICPEHQYVWETTTEPTVDSTGIKTGTCYLCDHTTTQTISKYEVSSFTSLPSDWELYSKSETSYSTSSVSNGELVLEHNDPNGDGTQSTYYGSLYNIDNGHNWTDFTYEVTFKINSASDKKRWIGLVYHTNYENDMLIGYGANYRYSNNKNAYTAINSDPKFKDCANTNGIKLNDGQYHTFKIVMEGNNVTNYMDDQVSSSWNVRERYQHLGNKILTSGGFALIINKMNVNIQKVSITGVRVD